eukprot:2420763-Alexandrium_andersonii.AAC.1
MARRPPLCQRPLCQRRLLQSGGGLSRAVLSALGVQRLPSGSSRRSMLPSAVSSRSPQGSP